MLKYDSPLTAPDPETPDHDLDHSFGLVLSRMLDVLIVMSQPATNPNSLWFLTSKSFIHRNQMDVFFFDFFLGLFIGAVEVDTQEFCIIYLFYA